MFSDVGNIDANQASGNDVNIQEKFTRVTEVLTPFSGLLQINPDVVAHAGRRGTRVHTACEAIMKGIGAWDVDDEIKPYIDSFMQWWSNDIKILAIEQRFYCSELMLTGQVDLIIERPEGAVILDLKTSYRPSKTWPLQGSAYAYMAKQAGYDIKGIHFLHLSKLGKAPKTYVYDDQWDMFKKCLDVFNYFYKKAA